MPTSSNLPTMRPQAPFAQNQPVSTFRFPHSFSGSLSNPWTMVCFTDLSRLRPSSSFAVHDLP